MQYKTLLLSLGIILKLNIMETPKQYAERKLKENKGFKGMARIFISNMLLNSYLKSDKDFYSTALKELDKL